MGLRDVDRGGAAGRIPVDNPGDVATHSYASMRAEVGADWLRIMETDPVPRRREGRKPCHAVPSSICMINGALVANSVTPSRRYTRIRGARPSVVVTIRPSCNHRVT